MQWQEVNGEMAEVPIGPWRPCNTDDKYWGRVGSNDTDRIVAPMKRNMEAIHVNVGDQQLIAQEAIDKITKNAMYIYGAIAVVVVLALWYIWRK